MNTDEENHAHTTQKVKCLICVQLDNSKLMTVALYYSLLLLSEV